MRKTLFSRYIRKIDWLAYFFVSRHAR